MYHDFGKAVTDFLNANALTDDEAAKKVLREDGMPAGCGRQWRRWRMGESIPPRGMTRRALAGISTEISRALGVKVGGEK